MTETRLWDRAAVVPARPDGRRLPRDRAPWRRSCRRSPSCSTSCATRSCASRPCGCGSRSGRRRRAARTSSHDGRRSLRHPGDARVTTTRAGDGRHGPTTRSGSRTASIVRTYASAHGLGTQRPVRNRPRGLDDRGLPGSVAGLRAGHGAADGDPARHVRPPGRLLPERPRHRPLPGHRHRHRRRGREAILLECDHPRTTEVAGDRPDFHISIAVDRDTGVILRLVEIDRRHDHPARRGRRARARCAAAAAPPSLRLPHRDDDALLSRPGSPEALDRSGRIEPETDA